jgi:hypothetical protein
MDPEQLAAEIIFDEATGEMLAISGRRVYRLAFV